MTDDNSITVLGSHILEIDSNANTQRKYVPISSMEIGNYIVRRNPLNHMSVCFRTEKIKSVGGYPNIYFKEDYALWIKLHYLGLKIENLDEILVTAHFDAKSILRRGGVKYVMSEWELLKFRRAYTQLTSRNIFYFIARSFIFLLPSCLRYFFYKNILRN